MTFIFILGLILLTGIDTAFYAAVPREFRFRYPWYIRYLPGSGLALYLLHRRERSGD